MEQDLKRINALFIAHSDASETDIAGQLRISWERSG